MITDKIADLASFVREHPTADAARVLIRLEAIAAWARVLEAENRKLRGIVKRFKEVLAD